MDDLEDRLSLMGQRLRASAPPVADVAARSRTVHRRRRVVQIASVAGLVIIVAVGAVSIGAVLDSPSSVVVGSVEDDPSPPGGPPSEQMGNPGRLDVGTEAGRLVVELEIVPGRVEALRDVNQAMGGGERGTDSAALGPEWVLLNAEESEVTIEFGSGANLERWGSGEWVPVAPLPGTADIHELTPGSAFRGIVPLVEIPDFDVFVEASGSGDAQALIDALRPLQPGWYRMTTSVTPTASGTSDQSETFKIQATFEILDPSGST